MCTVKNSESNERTLYNHRITPSRLKEGWITITIHPVVPRIKRDRHLKGPMKLGKSIIQIVASPFRADKARWLSQQLIRKLDAGEEIPPQRYYFFH